jgi:hypothetical protein
MKKTCFLILISPLLFFGLQLQKPNATIDFLNTLNAVQKRKAQLPFEDSTRTTWHFLPASMWERPGIPLKELSTEQKTLLFKLLDAFLSETGHNKILKIIDLENVLLELSGNAVMRDPERYYTAFYGNPEEDSLWAWSFEGHHISLNFTIANGKTSMTPRFLGANPAIVKIGNQKGRRTLANEDDLGIKLINSMSEEQKQTAIFQKQPLQEIVTKNATKAKPLKPVGIKMAGLREEQKSILLSLIDEYLKTMPTELAIEKMAALKKEELNDITFGWAGAFRLGEPHYYRIQGKSFLIEFDNTQNDANHIHTVWRDFNGDFGEDLIKAHYQKSNHHH